MKKALRKSDCKSTEKFLISAITGGQGEWHSTYMMIPSHLAILYFVYTANEDVVDRNIC